MLNFEETLSYWKDYLSICEEIDRETPQNDWVSWWNETEKAKQTFELLTGWNLYDFAKEVNNDGQ